MKTQLFQDFDAVSSKQWKQQIQYELKGADYNDTLVWESLEGIKVRPFYHNDETKIKYTLRENNTPFSLSRDPHQCAFGKWYDNFKTDNEDLRSILNRFDEPHKKIHALADSLLNMAKQGHKKQAQEILATEKRTTFTLLLRLFESAREQVVLDYKPIIIFTTKDGQSPHIGLLVDKVEDSVSVDASDIKPLDKLTSIGFDIDPQTRNMMRGLIKMDKYHSVIIDSSAIFKPLLESQQSPETIN